MAALQLLHRRRVRYERPRRNWAAVGTDGHRPQVLFHLRRKHTTIGAPRKFGKTSPTSGRHIARSWPTPRPSPTSTPWPPTPLHVGGGPAQPPLVCAVTPSRGTPSSTVHEEKIRPEIRSSRRRGSGPRRGDKNAQPPAYTVRVAVYLNSGQVFNLQETFPKDTRRIPSLPRTALEIPHPRRKGHRRRAAGGTDHRSGLPS